jgi:hypothetical protein
MGFFVFITDGQIDDFEEVKDFTEQLSKDVDKRTVNKVKLVLVGVGHSINRAQLAELDDLPDERDLPVDVWDHKIVGEKRDIADVVAEVVDENKKFDMSASALDHNKEVRKKFEALPALIEFDLPLDATSFHLEITGGKLIKQPLYEEGELA